MRAQRHRVSTLIAAVLFPIIWFTSAYADSAVEDLEELKVVYAGPISAHFLGTSEELQELEFGVTQLAFRFEGDERYYFFNPEGELYFSDWSFEIFSPTAKYVHLLQDRFGPYHIVQIGRLREYLLESAAPDFVVGHGQQDQENAYVHSDAHWVSETEFRYSATCCGTSMEMSLSLVVD